MATLKDDFVIGAPLADLQSKGDNDGRVYIFDGQTGEQRLAIDNPDPLAGTDSAHFGDSIATLGADKVVVGAHRANPGGIQDAGLVYVFDAHDGHLINILVSAPQGGINGQQIGMVYLFEGLPEPLLGDTDDFDVDLDDFNNVRNHFGGSRLGDTDGDDDVDLDDLNAVRNNFGRTIPRSAVPEPPAAALAAGALVPLVCMVLAFLAH